MRFWSGKSSICSSDLWAAPRTSRRSSITAFSIKPIGFIVTNLTKHSKNVVKFYNGRGTAEQWIKEGKNAVKWTKLSCRTFKDNQTRLQLFALAYNLANFLRRLALPQDFEHWSLTTLREKLVKIGAKVTRHAKYVTFQLAEVAVPRRPGKTRAFKGNRAPRSVFRPLGRGLTWPSRASNLRSGQKIHQALDAGGARC